MQGQLGFDGMPRKLIKVTPARLATWADCPRRYRMAYLDRPTPPRGGAWAHNTLGAVVHNALRAFFDLPVGKRTPETAAALVGQHWKSEGFSGPEQADRFFDLPVRRRTPRTAVDLVRAGWKDEGFAGPMQSAEYLDKAGGWVADYVAGLDVEMEPVGLERWVSAPVGRIVAEGRVDRIDLRGEELVIVDYKTGRHGLSTDDARFSPALALYAIAAARTLRKPCTKVELHHLPTGQVVSWEHTPESLGRHSSRAQHTRGDIQRPEEQAILAQRLDQQGCREESEEERCGVPARVLREEDVMI